METEENKYIAVSYELYTTNGEGITELVEKAPAEHPFQFISGMGFTLDAFEKHVAPLSQGDHFDFVLSKEEAYGDYLEEAVLHLDREMFCVNGHFDKENIYPGNVITLLDEEGNRLQALVLEVGEKEVTIDRNHPLSGCELHFKGKVVASRPATNAEIQSFVNHMSGGGCCCGDGGCCGSDDAHAGHGGHGDGCGCKGGCCH